MKACWLPTSFAKSGFHVPDTGSCFRPGTTREFFNEAKRVFTILLHTFTREMIARFPPRFCNDLVSKDIELQAGRLARMVGC